MIRISEDYSLHETLEYAKDSLGHYYQINEIPIVYRIDFQEMLDDDIDLQDLIKQLANTHNELYEAEEELDNYLDEKTLALKEFIEEEKKGMVLTEYDEI